MLSTGIPVEAAVAFNTALWPALVSEAVETPVKVSLRDKETMGAVCWEGAAVGRKLGRTVGRKVAVGLAVGCDEGLVEGWVEGWDVGCLDG
jgi:hypothetical protein